MGYKDLKKRFQEQKSQSEGGNSTNLYLKQDEKHQVRIVPRLLSENEEKINAFVDQFKFVKVHYNSNKVVPKTCFSPANFGETDALDDYYESERNSRALEKEEFKFLVNLKPKDSYITPVIVRGKEEEGVKLWVMSQKQFETLMDTMENTFYPKEPPAIWDIKNGHDITVEVKSPKATGKKYSETVINVQGVSSPLVNENFPKEVAKEDLKEQPLWDQAYESRTNEELLSYLRNHINQGSDASASADLYDEVEDYTVEKSFEDDDLSVDEAKVDDALAEFEKKKKSATKPKKEEVVDSEEEGELVEELDEKNPFDFD